MTNQVFLVRHASTLWTGRRYCGRADPPLSEIGLAEAVQLGRELAPRLSPDVRLLISPSSRAVETAEQIEVAFRFLAGRRLNSEIDRDLLEADFGEVEGQTWEDVAARHPALAAALLSGRSIDWPGGETAADLEGRARRVAAKLDEAPEVMVVVSHGLFIAALLRVLGPARMPWGRGLRPAEIVELRRAQTGWHALVAGAAQ